MRRVVITGMGAITPCGNTVGEFWNNIKNGKHGIAPITRFPTEEFRVKIAAEVKNFDVEQYIDKRESKRLDLFCQYALAAAKEAVEDCGLVEELKTDRAGVMVSTGIGGLFTIEEQVTRLNEKGPDRVSPLFIPMVIVNMAAGSIAIKHGIRGINTATVSACASGTHSIGEGFRNIKHGYSDIILAGGTEAAITRIGIAGFTSLTALSKSNNPDRASIPFDKDRDGFVMGEGAGIVVLEELEHALNRGAKIYAEVVGYGANCDAFHMTSPNPTGEMAAAAMKAAITEAGIEPSQVGYINAHGTSTPPNDLPETLAIKRVFGEKTEILVSSTKSMHGHLLGAAGAVEAIILANSLKDGFVPPTIGLETEGEGCDLDYVKKIGRPKDFTYGISNSFGFGGHNAVVCLKKWEGK